MKSRIMKFAAIADIHSNIAALQAVVADIRNLGINDIVCLGDVASGPMEAGKTIDLLMSLGVTAIRGNHDRYLIDWPREKMGSWDRPAYDDLESKQLDWIRELPPTRVHGEDVFLCHGIPADDETYWLETVRSDGAVCLSSLESIVAAAEGVAQSLILCGHTHIPRAVRLPDRRLIVNPGSVGCPGFRHDVPYLHTIEAGTPDASYAILERQSASWSVTFRQVPYDHGAMASLARERGHADWADVLETGWVTPRSK